MSRQINDKGLALVFRALILGLLLAGCAAQPAPERAPSVCVYPNFTMTLPDGAPCP